MPDPKPLLTKPRVMLATLRNRQGGFRVSWTGALRGGRWSSLLAMAAKRSPLSSMAPRKTDQDPGRLTHSGRITTVRDESASVESQTLIPSEPKPGGATLTGLVSMPKRESAPSSPIQPKLPESIPVVVVVPRPPPPVDTPEPPPLPPRLRLRAKSSPPPLKRQPKQSDLRLSPPPPQGVPKTRTSSGPSISPTRHRSTTTHPPPDGLRPVPPPKRFGPSRRPVRALLSTAPLPLTGLGSAVQQPPTLAQTLTPGQSGVGPKPPRPPRPTRPLDMRGPVDARPLPQPPEGSSPLPPSSAPPLTREHASAPPTPPRLPPRITKPLPPLPKPPPRLGPTALGLVSTQVGADRALGLVRRDTAPLLVRPRRDPNRAPPPLPPKPLTSPQGMLTPQPRDPSESTPPQGLVLSPTDLIPPRTPTPPREGFGSRLRAATLPLGLAPILSRGSSPTQVRFAPELTTVVPSITPVTQSPSSMPLPPREPTLLERARGQVSGQTTPPPPTIKTASEQLKEAHELSDRLDKVVKSIPKTVVGQDPTVPPVVDLTPGRTTGAEALTQAHELSDRLDKVVKSIPKTVVGQDPTVVDLTPGRTTGADALTQAHELSDRLDKVTDSIHGPKPVRIGLKRMPRGGLLTPSTLVLGSVNPPQPMRSTDRQVIVPEQVGGSPSSTTQAPTKTGSVSRVPVRKTSSVSDLTTDDAPKTSPMELHRDKGAELAKRAAAAWWPTWTPVPTRPPSTTALTERFTRALYIAELRAAISPSSAQKRELDQLEADEGADLFRFGSHISLDWVLDRPFKGEMPKEPVAKSGGMWGRANAMLARAPSLQSVRDVGDNPMAVWQRGVVGGRAPGRRGSGMGTPRPMRDTGTSHTIIPDVPASMLDSVSTLDGNVGESGGSSRAERYERSPRGRSEKQKTVLDDWRKRDIRDTDFDEDRTLARMALEDLMFEEKVKGKRPETRDRDLQKKLENLVGSNNSKREAEYLAEEIDSQTNLRPEERVRWHRASSLAARAHDSWWPTWITREVKKGRLQAVPEAPSLRSMAARYARALEFVELRDKPKRTPEEERRFKGLAHEEDAQRSAVGSWLHLDLLLKRRHERGAAPVRKSGVTISDDPSAPIVIHDDVEQIVIATRKRSGDGSAPPRPQAQKIPPVPTPPPVPIEEGGLEREAQSKLGLSSESPTAPPRPTSPTPTVDQLLSAMDENTLARLVQRVLDDKQAGGAVLARAIDLLERRARFGALREVR